MENANKIDVKIINIWRGTGKKSQMGKLLRSQDNAIKIIVRNTFTSIRTGGAIMRSVKSSMSSRKMGDVNMLHVRNINIFKKME